MTQKPGMKQESTREEDQNEAVQNAPKEESSVDEITALKQQLEAVEQERNQFKTLALRAQADFENYQKRAQREQEQQRRYAALPLAMEMLEVLDNLERAVHAAQQAGEKGSLVDGVVMVVSQFLEALKRHGVQRMDDLIGKPFDLERHQAVLRQPTADHAPNTVVAVLKQGYLLHDRVLRPADVAVAAPMPE